MYTYVHWKHFLSWNTCLSFNKTESTVTQFPIILLFVQQHTIALLFLSVVFMRYGRMVPCKTYTTNSFHTSLHLLSRRRFRLCNTLSSAPPWEHQIIVKTFHDGHKNNLQNRKKTSLFSRLRTNLDFIYIVLNHMHIQVVLSIDVTVECHLTFSNQAHLYSKSTSCS